MVQEVDSVRTEAYVHSLPDPNHLGEREVRAESSRPPEAGKVLRRIPGLSGLRNREDNVTGGVHDNLIGKPAIQRCGIGAKRGERSELGRQALEIRDRAVAIFDDGLEIA